MLFSIIAALIAGIITQNAIISGAFLVLPFATIIGQLFKPVHRKSDHESQKKKDEDK